MAVYETIPVQVIQALLERQQTFTVFLGPLLCATHCMLYAFIVERRITQMFTTVFRGIIAVENIFCLNTNMFHQL